METFSKLIIDDFEHLFWPIKQDTKNKLEKRGSKIMLFLCLDWFICSVIIGPAEVMFWRGIWESNREIVDNDVFHHNLIESFIATLLIDVFHHNLAGIKWQKSSSTYYLVCRVFSLVWGIVDITYWKGIWEGVDACAGSHFSVPATTLVIGSIILFATKCVKSAVSSPVGITLDESSSHIGCSTFLNSDQSDGYRRRFADAIISRFIEAAVILMWHGIWTLTDCCFKMLGLDALRSAFLSIIIGAIGSGFLFLIQFPLVYWKMDVIGKEKDDVDTNCCLLFANMCFSYMGSYFCINSYRGIWYLMDLTFLPDNKLYGHYCSLIISGLVLLLTNSVSCLHAGIVRDFPSHGVSIPYYYTSYFYIKKMDKNIDKKKVRQAKEVENEAHQLR